MPTKKRRVGFIPRDDVMKIIDRLSIENNLSNSKIIGILVEEALSKRGILNKKNVNEVSSYQNITRNSRDFSELASDYKANDKFTIDTKLGNYENTENTSFLKQTNPEAFDLITYKKFLSFLKFQELMDEYNS